MCELNTVAEYLAAVNNPDAVLTKPALVSSRFPVDAPTFYNGKTTLIRCTEPANESGKCETIFRAYGEADWIRIIKNAKDAALAANPEIKGKNVLVLEMEKFLVYPDGAPFGMFYVVDEIKMNAEPNAKKVDGYYVATKRSSVHRQLLLYYLMRLDDMERLAALNNRTFEEQLATVDNFPLDFYALDKKRGYTSRGLNVSIKRR